MNKDVLDVEDFLVRVGDDKELVVELIGIFEQDYGEKRKNLGEAIEKKDIENIRNIAHSMKGASGNISAKAMHATCLKIEESAKDATLEGIDGLLSELDKNSEDLNNSIAELRSEFK